MKAVLLETDINQCSSEEADPKIFRHVINLGKKGYTNVRVKAIDSDVVILRPTHADVAMSNEIESFLEVYGPKDKKIVIIDNFNKLDTSVYKAPAFFHAFTACNTVLNFYKVGKVKFWTFSLAKAKAGDTTLSNIFTKFSNCPMNIEVNEFDTLCNFFYEAYGLTKEAPDDLISTSNVKLRMVVPSPSGILQHMYAYSYFYTHGYF